MANHSGGSGGSAGAGSNVGNMINASGESPIKGAISWEDVLAETIKLATSSLGLGAGIIGIIIAPIAVSLVDHTIEAFKANAKVKKDGTAPESETLKQAEKAAKNDDAEKATELVQKAASEGDPKALCALGLSLLETNPSEGEYLLLTASKAGYDDATLQLAIHLNGKARNLRSFGMTDDADILHGAAMSMLKKLSDKNNIWGILTYAEELFYDDEFDRGFDTLAKLLNPLTFFKYLRSDPRAKARACVLASYIQDEDNVKDKKRLLEQAVKIGDPLAYNNLAALIEDEDPKRALELYRIAANNGVDQAVMNLVEFEIGRRKSRAEVMDSFMEKLKQSNSLTDLKCFFVAAGVNVDSPLYKDFFNRRLELWKTKGYKGRDDYGEFDPYYRGKSLDNLAPACAGMIAGYLDEDKVRHPEKYGHITWPEVRHLEELAEQLGFEYNNSYGKYFIPKEMLNPEITQMRKAQRQRDEEERARRIEEAEKLMKEGKLPVIEKPKASSKNTPPKGYEHLPEMFWHVRRNDPCPCGSGKKFKNCHGRDIWVKTTP